MDAGLARIIDQVERAVTDVLREAGIDPDPSGAGLDARRSR
jgi:hypothetical protein